MPIYTWRCEDCDATIEVRRTSRNYDVPPTETEAQHPTADEQALCPCSGVKRIITAPARISVPENEDQYWK